MLVWVRARFTIEYEPIRMQLGNGKIRIKSCEDIHVNNM